MNMLARLIPQPQPEMAQVPDAYPLDLDPDFEEACRQSLQEPMQTDEERTVEAMENLVTLYTDKGTKIDGEIAALEKALSDKREEKYAAARLCAWATTALADLKYDPADDAKKSYDLAVEVKRKRGDTTWPTRASEEAPAPAPKPDKRKKVREAQPA